MTSMKDEVYSSDEFRMFCMKILQCPKKVRHDWQVCPFAHAREKARRRCLRSYQYCATMCPDMLKNKVCPRGDKCHMAHSVFEEWLHPDKYRTVMCKDILEGRPCTRSMCFFAHSTDELRAPAAPTGLPLEHQQSSQSSAPPSPIPPLALTSSASQPSLPNEATAMHLPGRSDLLSSSSSSSNGPPSLLLQPSSVPEHSLPVPIAGNVRHLPGRPISSNCGARTGSSSSSSSRLSSFGRLSEHEGQGLRWSTSMLPGESCTMPASDAVGCSSNGGSSSSSQALQALLLQQPLCVPAASAAGSRMLNSPGSIYGSFTEDPAGLMRAHSGLQTAPVAAVTGLRDPSAAAAAGASAAAAAAACSQGSPGMPRTSWRPGTVGLIEQDASLQELCLQLLLQQQEQQQIAAAEQFTVQGTSPASSDNELLVFTQFSDRISAAGTSPTGLVGNPLMLHLLTAADLCQQVHSKQQEAATLAAAAQAAYSKLQACCAALGLPAPLESPAAAAVAEDCTYHSNSADLELLLSLKLGQSGAQGLSVNRQQTLA